MDIYIVVAADLRETELSNSAAAEVAARGEILISMSRLLIFPKRKNRRLAVVTIRLTVALSPTPRQAITRVAESIETWHRPMATLLVLR